MHSGGNRGGHLVFGNPALPIPENPKAKHPTSDEFCTKFDEKRKKSPELGQGVATRSLEAQPRRSQRILKPSAPPENRERSLSSQFGSLDHEDTGPMKATSEVLTVKQAKRHTLCQGNLTIEKDAV